MEYRVELKTVTSPDEVRIEDDPVRKGYSYDFRMSDGRKIFTIPDKAVVCVAQTTKIPTTMDELKELSTPKTNEFSIFYTVWSYDKGAGREIVINVSQKIKKRNL